MVNKKEIEDGKACAILAYLLVGIIWYLADDKMKKNNYVKYHVKQGLMLLIVSVVMSIITPILVFIPILGWLVILIVNIFLLVVFILGVINSATGKEKELPIIGKYAKKYFTF